MSGRRLRKVLLFAAVAGVAYWMYHDRPTVSGIVDSLTNPLLGSKAAVETSERNRVVGDASSAITEQTDASVGALREGMTKAEVRELLGDPQKIENAEGQNPAEPERWTYTRSHRVVVFQAGRVASIVLQ